MWPNYFLKRHKFTNYYRRIFENKILEYLSSKVDKLCKKEERILSGLNLNSQATEKFF